MNPFNPRAICEKCGFRTIASVYHAPSHEYTAFGERTEIPDHILRRCERCGYHWNEAVLNLSGKPLRLVDPSLLDARPKDLTAEQRKERRRLQCQIANRRWLDNKAAKR